jgi:hypothetical protein
VGVNLSRDSKLKITKDLLTHDSRSHTPLNSRLKITQQLLTHPNSSESRDALTSRMPSSIFSKMLRGGFALSGYRPSNDQPIEFGALHVHFDMPLTTAALM